MSSSKDHISRGRAARMLRRHAVAATAVAIAAQESVTAHSAAVFGSRPPRLKAHVTGFNVAALWNSGVRDWVSHVNPPGLVIHDPLADWAEFDVHGHLHLHLNRDAINQPTTDTQRSRLTQGVLPLGNMPPAHVTNVELVARRSPVTGHISRAVLCAPYGGAQLWEPIVVDVRAAERLLRTWRDRRVPWLTATTNTLALTQLLSGAAAHSMSPAAPIVTPGLPSQFAPVRVFRAKPGGSARPGITGTNS